MKRALTFLATLALALAYSPASAQDPSAAAEQRARLANQRIEAEARRRAEEEERILAQEANLSVAEPAASGAASQAPAVASAPARSIPSVSPDSASRSTAGDRDDLSLVLEQLKSLGELKDAGYVDDEEFERIKQRIIDGGL